MSKFEIRNHLDKLQWDGGSQSGNDKSFLCPVCGSTNFKVNTLTGKWSSYGCSCALTESGKRKIRQALSPAKSQRPKQERSWIYKDDNDFELIKVNRIDSGDGKRKFWQESLIDREPPRELSKRVKPYKYKEAIRALAEGHEYVFWVEGESCVDAMWRINLPAITTLGGSKFKPERDSNLFPAEKVVVVPDLDQVGIKHAKNIEHHYQGCKVLHPFPDHHHWQNPPKDGGIDIADWIGSGASETDIYKALKTTSDRFIEEATTLKNKLEDGLQKIDKLENVMLRTCALATLKKELGLSSGNLFDELVNTLLRSNENDEPTDFDSIMASDDGLKPIVNSLLAVGLTLMVGDGFSGKTSLIYQLLEAISNGFEFAGQFPTTKAHTMIIQLDEPKANMKQKFRRMALDPNRENFKVVWNFHPLMIPELEKWIVKHNTKVLAIDSLLRVCDGIQDICSAEMGLFIYRLNKIASKHNISIILVHHLNRDQKKQAKRVVTKNDIYGSGYIYNGTSDCYAFWKVKEEDSSEYRWILKNLKARSSIVDENETYEFSGNEEDYRFLYERMGSREISLKELNNKTEMVRQFILRNPTDKYTPKQVSTILQLNNAKWAANILSGLNGRGEIGKIEATDINTGGRKTYYYFAKGKPPI